MLFDPFIPFRTRKVVSGVAVVDPELVWEVDRVGVGDEDH